MSSTGDILARIKGLFSFVKRDRPEKRPSEEYEDHNLLRKYRRVTSDFPKVINKPFDDDSIFIRPYKQKLAMSNNRRSNEYRSVQPFSRNKLMLQTVLPYADNEFSDDENDGEISQEPQATSSRNVSMLNGNSRFNTKIVNIPINVASRKPPPPPLIEPRTGIITTSSSSQIPSLQRIRKVNYNPVEYTNGYTTNGVGSSMGAMGGVGSLFESTHRSRPLQSATNTLGSFRDSYCNRSTKSIMNNFNEKEREGYMDLLKCIVPSLYDTNSTVVKSRKSLLPLQENSSKENDQSTAARRKSRLGTIINLIDDETKTPEPKEIIDLSYDDMEILVSCQKSKSQNKNDTLESKREPPRIEPVNSLKDKFNLHPTLQPTWLENFKGKYAKLNSQRKQQILEEEENIKKISRETELNERIIEQRLKDFMIESETIVLDESEPETEEEEFPELTKQRMEIIQSAVYKGPDSEVLISKFNMNITRRDIKTLVGTEWLNDEVINFYMNLLMERGETRANEGFPRVYAMNTFFIPRLMQSGHSGVRRWTRKVDIFSYDIIPVPVHVGGVHWCMAIIHLKNKTIKYYDSMGQPNNKVLKALENYLKEELQDKKKLYLDTSCFLMESVGNVPRQMNGSDCGVFSCMFAEYITRDRNITFSQEHMSYMRKKMILEIVQGKLLL